MKTFPRILKCLHLLNLKCGTVCYCTIHSYQNRINKNCMACDIYVTLCDIYLYVFTCDICANIVSENKFRR